MSERDERTATAALQHLPLVAAPDDVWESIERSLDAPAPATVWRYAMAACLVAVMAGGWYMYRSRGGGWLETDAQSRAQIRIGEIGTVDVGPNTSVRVVTAQAGEHRLELRTGSLTAKITAPPRLFFVDTPAGTAIDLGCEYDLQCDRKGTGLLRVRAGWVAYERKGRESLVPAGASCRTREGKGPGTPYFDDASQRLVAALDVFDSGTAVELKTILTESRARDTLTLWHLLSRVEGADRADVYDRMTELAPPPTGVSREQVMNLDTGALKRWREELAWIW